MNSLLRAFVVASFAGGTITFAQSASSSTNTATQAQSSVSSYAAMASGSAAGATGAQSSLQPGHAAASIASMTSVQSELTSKVDSKNATVGQEVIAKTRQTARLADGTTLPKGTKLVGHITEVQSHGKGHADSALTMAFDRAELRDGRSIPLRSVLRSIAQPAAAASASGEDSMMAGADTGPIGAGASVASGGRGGLGVGGGGLMGATGSAVHSTGTMAGSALTTTTRATGSTLNTAGQAAVGTTSETGAAVSTGIPGVMLSSSASSDTSGTLTASGRNIALDSGTQMTLGLAAQ